MILNSAVVETSVLDWKREAVSVFDSNVNKIFLRTDGAASSRVGQILSLRVEGSIPYSAPLKIRIGIKLLTLLYASLLKYITDQSGYRYASDEEISFLY